MNPQFIITGSDVVPVPIPLVLLKLPVNILALLEEDAKASSPKPPNQAFVVPVHKRPWLRK